MKFYQLVAYGRMKVFAGNNKFYSREIYLSRESAEADAKPFFERCCNGDTLNDLDAEHSHVDVVELECKSVLAPASEQA